MPVYLSARAAQLAADACLEFAERAKVRAQGSQDKAREGHEAMAREYEALAKAFKEHVRTPVQWRRRK